MFFGACGHQQFQKALADEDTLNQKRCGSTSPATGAGFHINNVTLDYAFTNLANQATHYTPMCFPAYQFRG